MHYDAPEHPGWLDADGAAVRTALHEAFVALQARLQAEYEQAVVPGVLALKRRIERESGYEMPMALPCSGGTTATVAVVYRGVLHVAWVGDSRAIVIERADGAVRARRGHATNVAAEPAPSTLPPHSPALNAPQIGVAPGPTTLPWTAVAARHHHAPPPFPPCLPAGRNGHSPDGGPRRAQPRGDGAGGGGARRRGGTARHRHRRGGNGADAEEHR